MLVSSTTWRAQCKAVEHSGSLVNATESEKWAWARQCVCSDQTSPARMPKSKLRPCQLQKPFVLPLPLFIWGHQKAFLGKAHSGDKRLGRNNAKMLVFLSLEVLLQNNHRNCIRIGWLRERKWYIYLSQYLQKNKIHSYYYFFKSSFPYFKQCLVWERSSIQIY